MTIPLSFSGGQKQRVAIARALAMQPEILLFDEVTSALDPELVEEVQSVLRRIATETDATMLLVTHKMSFAHSISDRVLFFDRGRIVGEQGPPAAIFKTPQEESTRSLLKKILKSGVIDLKPQSKNCKHKRGMHMKKGMSLLAKMAVTAGLLCTGLSGALGAERWKS